MVMKLKSEIQAEYVVNGIRFAEVFTTDEFINLVTCGDLSPHSGYGNFHTGYHETDISVWDQYPGGCSYIGGGVYDTFPYVIWYDK